MPRTKFQEVVFAALMCFFMVLAMELYNTAFRFGGMSNACWIPALMELRIMLPICFVMSFFFLDPLAQRIAFAQVSPGVDNWLQTIVRNFPMALCWQVFFCGPLVRRLFRTLFRKQLQAA